MRFFFLTSNLRRGRREPLEVKLKITKRVKKKSPSFGRGFVLTSGLCLGSMPACVGSLVTTILIFSQLEPIHDPCL